MDGGSDRPLPDTFRQEHDKDVVECRCIEHVSPIHHGTAIMNVTDHVVGADLSCTSPIYRPGEPIDGPLADKSAVRQ